MAHRGTAIVALGLTAAGAFATAGLGPAPAANATCISAFGLSSSADCTSNLTSIAIAIGNGAVAHADGLFGGAFAMGTYAQAWLGGVASLAVAVGPSTSAIADGLFGILGAGNIAVNIATDSAGNRYGVGDADSTATAYGVGNVAVNLFGNGSSADSAPGGCITVGALCYPDFPSGIVAVGLGNIAVNLLGNYNTVAANGFGNAAFSANGRFNNVTAGTGPFAIAGLANKTGVSITKAGPGFNINGAVIGGASAVRSAASNPVVKPAAAATRATAGVAASRRPSKK
jgi:hypothetical protein